MRFRLALIARHFQDASRSLRQPPSVESLTRAERAYAAAERELGAIPWEPSTVAKLKELFRQQQQLREMLDHAALTLRAQSARGWKLRELETGRAISPEWRSD